MNGKDFVSHSKFMFRLATASYIHLLSFDSCSSTSSHFFLLFLSSSSSFFLINLFSYFPLAFASFLLLTHQPLPVGRLKGSAL